MQLFASRNTRSLLAFTALLVVLSGRSLATTITFSSSAVSTFTLAPSSDTFSMNASSGSDPGLGLFTFQTGDFVIGDSEIPDQVIPFSFQDTVTLNGVTQTLNIFGQNNVTTTSDNLTIFAGSPVLFGNKVFTLQSFTASGTNLGQDLSVNLQADVETLATPEPASLLLLGTGLLSPVIVLRLKGDKKVGRLKA